MLERMIGRRIVGATQRSHHKVNAAYFLGGHMPSVNSDNHSSVRNQEGFIAGGLTTMRHYHMTRKVENPLFYGGVMIFAGAVIGQAGLKAYEAMSAAQARAEAEAAGDEGEDNDETSSSGEIKKKKKSSREGGSMFSGWFAKNFYQGGFEEKMTKREAALILGVREHASADRIKDAHRKILILNHPDRGGSPLLSAKINEAKDLLMKGKEE